VRGNKMEEMSLGANDRHNAENVRDGWQKKLCLR
jgi:hypothetical protein